jgi:hypothetical protein
MHLPSRRGWAGLVLVVLVALVAASLRLFVWPPTDLPQRADAAVALGGDPGQLRAKEAIRLVRQGYAPVAVISLGGTTAAPCPHPEPKVPVICFRADPLDTRGEAEYVGALAQRRHWLRLIVVPERSQATRARMLFERCTKARLIVVPIADRPSSLFVAIPYEWGALVKALVKRGC